LVAEKWFLKIDGIEGDSTDDAHPGEIDVLSWSWGATNTRPPGSGGGSGAGRASFQDFQFVARISKASPQLVMSCATGMHHEGATLSGVRTGEKMRDFLTYKLGDVLVTSVRHGDGEGDVPTEQFSLDYARFEMSFTPPTGPPVTAGIDLKTGKKV
jgi:type VI secretion system secreted protein Hcp